MFELSTELDFENELLDELKLFTQHYGNEKIYVEAENAMVFSCNVIIDGTRFVYEGSRTDDKKSTFKRFVKLSFYRSLSKFYNATAPWGSLIGVRPTKLAYERFNATNTYDGIAEYLRDEFLVSENKAKIAERILRAQCGLMNDVDNKVNLYVHIPFCNGRCSYCSFPSAEINKHGGQLEGYVDALIREIVSIKQLINEQNKEILSVYVGGGTPSVLTEQQMERLLSVLDLKCEFTFEAGRPDSITAEKLSIMASGGVTRICINPQSLNDKTLEAIGRKHTVKEFYQAYELSARAGLSINTDIIAGLQGESFSDFSYTLDSVAALSPDNITVHTLSRKRGSDLAESLLECNEIEKMLDYAYAGLQDYEPYYLYRQKYMLGNFENIGFCKPGKACVNNITVMEETVPVYACGAGSISKAFFGRAIVRHQSPKEVKMYMEQFDDRLSSKISFLSGIKQLKNKN